MKKSIYIASSWKNAHAVEMLTDIFEGKDYEVKSFIRNANEEHDLPDFNAWIWSDAGKTSFDYDSGWAAKADIVVYVGPSGCDAWAEIGIAYANNRPIYALQAKGEPIGLMRRLITKWFEDHKDLVAHIVNESPVTLIRELDELLGYGFKEFRDSTGPEETFEYVKSINGVRWGVHIEDAGGGEKKVCITKNTAVIRHCSTMESLTEKLIEYNLLK